MKSQNSIMRIERLTLPDTFAQEVLELEETLASSVEIELVNRLMALYTLAIEFYESQKDSKYEHYISRMRCLMSDPQVLGLLNQPRSHMRRKTQSDASVNLKVQRELLDYNNKSTSTLKKIQNNLKVQDFNLTQRVKERRRNLSVDRTSDTDISNEPLCKVLEIYEEKVQEVIEWYLNQRQIVIRKIQEKYQTQIQEVSELCDDFHLLDRIIAEMKNKMKNEIADASAQIEQQKRNRISEVRAQIK